MEDATNISIIMKTYNYRGYRGCDPSVVWFTTTSIYESRTITTNVVISNLAHGEVYSIQHYVIQFVSHMQQVGGFPRVLWFPTVIKLTAKLWQKYCWKSVKHHNPNYGINLCDWWLNDVLICSIVRLCIKKLISPTQVIGYQIGKSITIIIYQYKTKWKKTPTTCLLSEL